MKYIQALKEQGYNLKALPTDIKKAINLILKSKDYNSKVEALDFITFNSIRNSQPVDERIEELHKLSLTDHSVEDNNGFNTPLSIEIAEEQFASGGHIAPKGDNNKVRNWKVRFHLGRGENFMNWKVENPTTKEVDFYKPEEVQIEMYNCKLTNSPATATKIFTGEIDKSPIAWVVCERVKVDKKIEPVDPDERLSYNPRTAPNWFDTDGKNVDNYVFEKLVTFGRGVYYETPDGKLFALGGFVQEKFEFEIGGVFHGSSYLFEKFQTEKIGSGIGQQQDGWGIYLTDDKESSKNYGNYIYETTLFKDKKPNEYQFLDLDKPVKKDLVKKIVKAITEYKNQNFNENKFNSYYENIKSNDEELPKVEFNDYELISFDYRGYLFYKTLSRILGGDKKASLFLLDNGISGLRRKFENYQGNVYRTDYVLFDENSITIKSKEKLAHNYYSKGGETKKSGKDIYENNILQIRIIGGEPNYYKRVNQEWKFLSPDELERLKIGTKHELEHSATIEAFKRRDIPNETIASFIAYDHINEDPNYYQKLDKAIPEQMSRGKKIDIPVVFKQTMGDYKIWIEEVKSTNGEVFYGGEVYLKDMLLKIFPAVSSDLEELKKVMRKFINDVEISANENAKNIIFINGKSNKVSEDIYKYVLSKMKPSIKQNQTDSLRHAIENTISAGDLSVDTDFTKYDDIDALRSKMLEILRKEEGDNSYSVPYSWEAYSDLKTRAYNKLNEINLEAKSKIVSPELVVNSAEPTMEIKENEMENNNTITITTKWNEVPVRWKNVRAIRPTTFNLNPYDKGLNNLVKQFVGDDGLRPVMTGMNFSKSGIVCTDAHKLLHIKYTHSDFSGNYATANTMKAVNKKDLEDATKEIKDTRFPNWEAVVPTNNPFTYEVDTMKLYQYLKVAINYCNKTTFQVLFKYNENKAIGFNAKFFIDVLEVLMKMQKCTKVYLHLSEPSRAMVVSYDKNFSPTGSTFALVMPVILNIDSKDLKSKQMYGAFDIDYEKYLTCYFDFEDSEIHNGDGTIADYKESYGDSEEMPLSLITMLDKFIKIGKTRIPILENVCVDGNGIRVDDIDARIEIANDWKLSNGIYQIENNALIRNNFQDFDDFPSLRERVQTKNPTFTIDAEVFKFYITKAFQHIGEDDIRPILSTICFQYDQGGYLQVISTDAVTLFHANITKYASQIENKNFQYPLACTKQLMNFVKNIDSKEVKFYVDENRKYRIDGGRLHFEAKIEDGKYPSWEGVIPRDYNKQLSFDIKDLFVCMNNEVSKQYIKDGNLKLNDLIVYNQDDKIFLSKLPYNNEVVKPTEICKMSIKQETFDPEKKINWNSDNFVLLMPNTSTNGNYFNWAVEPLSKCIQSIGKEKVLVDYTDLMRAYIFTSDNLEYKTSDVYKPAKVTTTPEKSKDRSVGTIKEKKSVIIDQFPTPAPEQTAKGEVAFNIEDKRLELQKKMMQLSSDLNKYVEDKRNPSGMVKPEFRTDATYVKLQKEYDKAFAEVRNFNKKYPVPKNKLNRKERQEKLRSDYGKTFSEPDIEIIKAIRGLEALFFSFVPTTPLEESKAVQSAIKGLKALLK